MENKLLELKPNYVNAIVPLIFKYLLLSFIFNAIIYAIFYTASQVTIVEYEMGVVFKWLLIPFFAIFVFPILLKIVVLYNTKYLFYKTHVTMEFEFIVIRKTSIPYNQIVDIETKISLWDRLCKAGNIILHTAENNSPDLVLEYIEKPESVETSLHHLIYKQKKTD